MAAHFHVEFRNNAPLLHSHEPVMRRARLCFCRTLLFSLVTVGWRTTAALKHTFHRESGPPLIGPVGVPFGFLDSGHYELSVLHFELSSKSSSSTSNVEAGFLLQRFDNEAQFQKHLQELQSNRSACSFEYFRSNLNDNADDVLGRVDDAYAGVGKIPSAEHGIYLPVHGPHVSRKTTKTPNVTYQFQKGEAGLYFLLYQACPYDPSLRSSFDLDFHFLNVDSSGNPSFLTAGEMKLPTLFLFFSASYLILFVLWLLNNRAIQQGRPGYFDGPDSAVQPAVYPIHHLMTALVLVKFLATFLESLRYHFLKVTGHAEVWSVLFYVVTFVKGTFLFVVILLLGTGWSFVKPFLNPREKSVIAIILVLQVLNNIALTVLSQITEGERRYQRWTAILHLVDIACCCAVLVPIVWSVNALEKTMGDDELVSEEDEERALETGEKGQVLRKLRLFRSFYLLVVAYIYATRILVYLFATMLDYQHLWVQCFVVELVTLTFYVTVGCMFRPMADNPYLSIKKSEGTALELHERRSD